MDSGMGPLKLLANKSLLFIKLNKINYYIILYYIILYYIILYYII